MNVPIRFSALISAVLGVLAVPSVLRAEIININDLRQQGLATLTASQWDIGHMDALFDRNWSNLYRSAAINPAIVTVEFVEAHESGAMRILCAADSDHELILDAADTMADLENQTGSYVRILDRVIVPPDQIGWWEWNDAPVTRRIFRWSVERLTRDDFVHIREIEFQTAEPVEEIDIGGELVRINVIEVRPDSPEIPIGDQQQFDAEASLSYGPDRYDVTGLAAWSASDANVARLDGPGLFTAIGVGQSAINADIGVVRGEAQLDVRVVRPVDLNVGFIHRTPEFNRFKVVFNGDQRIDPAYLDEPKWPAPGQMVTYTAHIFNKGDLPAADVGYRWLFDGQVVEEGTIPLLDAGEAMQLAYEAAWPDDVVQTVDVPPGAHTLDPPQLERAIGEHLITLELDPTNAIEEGSELNNVVTDPINALSFWFYMDQSTYERFSREKSFLETFSPEDWARGQLLGLERRLWISEIPQRLRMDMLMVVEDGELNPGGVHEPFGTQTRQADGRWGFSWPDWYVARYAKVVEHALIHELGHQLGLVDIYQYDIATQNCLITHDGQLVAGTELMPLVSPWNVYYGNIRIFNDGGQAFVDGTPRGTMANPGAGYFARSSVSGMNRNFGLRRGFFGDYLGAIQQDQISLRVTHYGGAPVAFALVRVFQRELDSTVPDVPKFTGATDAWGVMPFPDHTRPDWHGGIDVNNPWSFEQDGVFYNAPDPVGRNAPYAGGFTTRHYGAPESGVHALQIEINRALYLDEERLQRGRRLAAVAADMTEVIEAMARFNPVMLAAE